MNQNTLDEDRQNRFLNANGTTGSDLGQRAASQPPRSSTEGGGNFLSSPTIPSSFGNTWNNNRVLSSASNSRGIPQPIPIRSSSFSNNQATSTSSSYFSSAMRDRSFPSTFEDEESEFSDTYDEHYVLGNGRGRNYAPDLSRSRSQSLATGRPTYFGGGGSTMASWNDSYLSSHSPGGSRFGEIKPPTSRYGSLGALGMGRTPPSYHHVPTTTNPDISNMSPFVRDVGQILLDDGSAFRELWAGMNPPRDENGGGGSGTTSRRHSVSVVQPRARGTIVGFNAPQQEPEKTGYSSFGAGGGRGGLMLSDEDLAGDLAGDLGLLSLNKDPLPPSLSRSPTAGSDVYQPMTTTGSPHQQDYPARFIPGKGIHYINTNANATTPTNGGGPGTPVSPTSARQPQQSPFFPRRPSDLSDVGKGLPLHSVPSSMPLYIVEFKAGRTDLFYLTDLSLDIRVGDLVMVEADRGKDLGKVVNDSITLAEVEAWQREKEGEPGSPEGLEGGGGGGGGGRKKEINPKMIYGKAQPQDAQLLIAKMQDEVKALQLCQNKVRAKKLPMEVVDAEYQWDRRKLTFYFIAEKRIDFRELVRELFRLYKTRIWMASLQGAPGSGAAYEQ